MNRQEQSRQEKIRQEKSRQKYQGSNEIEDSQILEDALVLQEFQAEVELLQKIDFSRGSAAQRRVQRRLEKKWDERSWWSFLWSDILHGLQTRVALASSALLLFAILNINGAFSLPQHSLRITPVPMVPLQIIRVTDLLATDTFTTDALAPGTLPADALLATTTPQTMTPNGALHSLVLMPTPMPVPAPLIEG